MIQALDSPSLTRKLPLDLWRGLAREHTEHARTITTPHMQRRSRGERHPVFDFMFDYYSFRTCHLETWSPGIGIVLEKDPEEAYPGLRWDETPDGLTLSLGGLGPRRRESLNWVLQLLVQTANRPPRFGCHGLHEWAMVYRSTSFRHEDYARLRLSREEINRLVESLPLCCTHYDAFRFYTDAARPLNLQQPDRGNRLDLEQRGCLHANMDLYKWAYKFWPWVDSRLLLDCFQLACRTRSVDMRASPYDLSELGFSPIRIETAEGRQEYEKEQRLISEEAQPLRLRLIQALEAVREGI